MKKRTDIITSDVECMYYKEGMNIQAIADYYGAGWSTISRRLNPQTIENDKQWRLEHPEYSKEYYQDHREEQLESARLWRSENPEYEKEWRLDHPEYKKEHNKEYYQDHSEEIKEQKKEYYQDHSEEIKEQKKEYLQTENGKAANRKHSAEHRELGFIVLNEPLENGEWHHIDEVHVISIPKELHRSIYHNVKSGQGMEGINAIAFGYITEEVFDNLMEEISREVKRKK